MLPEAGPRGAPRVLFSGSSSHGEDEIDYKTGKRFAGDFTEEVIQVSRKLGKRRWMSPSLGTLSLKPQQGTAACPPEWPKLRRLTIPWAGKKAEHLEHSRVAAGDAGWAAALEGERGFLTTSGICLPGGSAVPLLGDHPR